MGDSSVGRFRLSLFNNTLNERLGVLFENGSISVKSLIKEVEKIGDPLRGCKWVIEDVYTGVAYFSERCSGFSECELGKDIIDKNDMPRRSFPGLYVFEGHFGFVLKMFRLKSKIARFEYGVLYQIPGKMSEFLYIDSSSKVSIFKIVSVSDRKLPYAVRVEEYNSVGKSLNSGDVTVYLKSLVNLSSRERVLETQRGTFKTYANAQNLLDDLRDGSYYYKKAEGFLNYTEYLHKVYDFDKLKIVNKKVEVDTKGLAETSFKTTNDFKRFSEVVKSLKVKTMKLNTLYKRPDGKGYFCLLVSLKYHGFSFNEFYFEEVFSDLGTLLYYSVRGVYSCSSVSNVYESTVCGVFRSKKECADFISKKFVKALGVVKNYNDIGLPLDTEGKYYLTSVKDGDFEVDISIGRKTSDGRYEEKKAVLMKPNLRLIELFGKLDPDAFDGFKLAVTTPIVLECLRKKENYRFYLSVWNSDFTKEVSEKHVEADTLINTEGVKGKVGKVEKGNYYVNQRRLYTPDDSGEYTTDYLRVFDSNFRMVAVANSFEELKEKY